MALEAGFVLTWVYHLSVYMRAACVLHTREPTSTIKNKEIDK